MFALLGKTSIFSSTYVRDIKCTSYLSSYDWHILNMCLGYKYLFWLLLNQFSALQWIDWLSFCQSLNCQPVNILSPLYVTEDVTVRSKQDWQQARNPKIPHESIQLMVYFACCQFTLGKGDVQWINNAWSIMWDKVLSETVLAVSPWGKWQLLDPVSHRVKYITVFAPVSPSLSD